MKSRKLLQFVSDIHLEFYKNKIDIKDFITPCAAHLAILGDLGYPHSENFNEFLKQASNNFEQVFFISGNHEYYAAETMTEINNKIVEVCSRYPNVHYLSNQDYLLNEKIVLLGTTLWSYIPDKKKHKIKNAINDYSKIFIEENHYKTNISTQFITELHNQSVCFLKEKIEQYKDKDIIILTHHLPSFQLISSQYEGSDINYAFASDLEYLMLNNYHIKYWLCGHTHTKITVKINQCQCITNPLGYPGENDIEDEQRTKCIE